MMKGGENVTKLQKTATVASTVIGSLLITPVSVFAQNTINLRLQNGQFTNVANYTPTGVARAVINLILVLAGLVAFFFLLLGGLQWILAGGDKEGTEKARKRITAALIGLVVIFSAYAIMILASQFLGVDLLQFNINPIETNA